MKKAFLFLMTAVMLLTAGCGAQTPAETGAPAMENTTTEATQATEATEATEPQASTQPSTEALPETADALVLADHVPAILMFVDRGDSLDIVGEYDEEHLVTKTEDGYGLVQKVLIRTEGQEPYESWTGFARHNAGLYDNLNLRGEPAEVLTENTEVEVLEDLGTCLLVKGKEDTRFAAKEQISRWRIDNSGGAGESGGSEGQDGGDISLQSGGSAVLLSIIEQTGTVTGTAQVLADGTPVILGYFDRGDTVPVVVDPDPERVLEGYSLLYWDGIYAYTQFPMLQQPGSEPYAEWDGFAAANGKCYSNYNLTGAPVPGVWINVPVHVLADLGDCYLVEINGTLGYMARDQVSETQIPVYSGGSDDGGGGSREWSDPIL